MEEAVSNVLWQVQTPDSGMSAMQEAVVMAMVCPPQGAGTERFSVEETQSSLKDVGFHLSCITDLYSYIVF